jgi:tetratricopeptide (TPR) repeat protein
MNKTLFTFACLLAYLIGGFVLYSNWEQLVAFFELRIPNYGLSVAILFTVCLTAFSIMVQAQLSDLFIASEEPGVNLTPEARRKEAETEAQRALERGDRETAIRLYERVGLFHSALQLAEQIQDRDALIRLYSKLGRYERARKLLLAKDDYEGAALCSILMGEIPTSRNYFRKAAEAVDSRGNPRSAADLWNRAQELHIAAVLYEEAGESDQAAECYDLMGDSANAKRCLDQYKAMKAFEVKAGRLVDPKKEADIRADKLRSAALLQEMGDLFGAAELFRQAKQYEEAAKNYEKIEEWERAARCYDTAQKSAKAASCRTKSQPRTYEAPDRFSGTTMVSLPNLDVLKKGQPTEAEAVPIPQIAFASPAAITGSPKFQAIISQAPVFVTMAGIQGVHFGHSDGSSKGGPSSAVIALNSGMMAGYGIRPVLNPSIGIAQENMAQALRRGKIREAAKFAQAAEDHLLAAVLMEQAGDLIHAAETYRQIGRFKEAAYCMASHGDFLEAARLALATNQHGLAVRHLLQGIARDPSGHYAVSLAEVFLSLKNQPVAERIFRRYLATNGLQDKSHAEVIYRFAILFRDAGADRLALLASRALLGAGVHSPKLIELEEVLSCNTGESPHPQGVDLEDIISGQQAFHVAQEDGNGSGSTTKQRGEIASAQAGQKTRTRTRKRLSQTLHGDSIFDQPTVVPRDRVAAGDQPTGFDFEPPSDPGPRLVYVREDNKEGHAIDHGLSLFGRPEGTDDSTEEDPYAPANRYEIKNELGRGGMGVIYEALDTVLNRSVALKFILKSEGTTRDEFAQFLLEARAIARLTHPNIITIYDIGMLKAKHYIAMELVTGGSLSSKLRERSPFTFGESLRIFVETARGLQAAHKQGIVHRDVKPGNILLAENDAVRLVDFGLATLQSRSGSLESAETKFRHAGTPGFMAPEQIRGADPLPTADIYALGVILYFMLTGEPPHKSVKPASLNDVMAFQLKGVMPKIRTLRPDTPDALEHLYHYCTITNPSDRYQSIDQFLGDAEKYLQVLT